MWRLPPRMTAPAGRCARWAAVAVIALALTGCPNLRVARDVTAGIPSTRLPRPELIRMEGTYVHQGTGLAFPEAAAGFQRVDSSRFDEEGNDVGIGYSRISRDMRAEVTLYVFPPPRRPDHSPVDLDEHFEFEVGGVRDHGDGAREIHRSAGRSMHAGENVDLRAAEFEMVGGMGFDNRPVSSFLTVMGYGAWRVKYRVTVTKSRRDEAVADVEQLLAALGFAPLAVR